MSHVLASLIPIILLVTAGAALLGLGFYTDAFRRDLDRFVYWVAVPGLIIGKLASGSPLDPRAGLTTGALLLATAGAIVAGYFVAWLMRLPSNSLGVFVQSGFRGNLALMGLPVLVIAASQSGFDPNEVETQAMLVLAPMILVYNVAAVLVLELARHSLTLRVLPELGRGLIRNPLILSCLVGFTLGVGGVRIPVPLNDALVSVGMTAAPLALLSLGGSLVVYKVQDHIGLAAVGALVKLAIVPLLAWGIGTWLEVDPIGMLVLMVYSAAPTAVASYVMSTQLGGDDGLAASSIVVSTVLSAGSLAFALTWAA